MRPEHEKEDDYWLFVKSTQRRQYPGFVNQLSKQSGLMAEEGQAAVIEFQLGAKPSIINLPTSRALRHYFERTPRPNIAIRRDFILEGLPRKFIQVLGSTLRIPPSFFATHWASHGKYRGSLLNRTPRYYISKNRFLLSFPKLHQAEIKAHDGDDVDPIYHMDSSAHRPLSRVSVFGDLDGPLSSFEQLSYWCTSEGDNWDGKYTPILWLITPPLIPVSSGVSS